MNPTAPTLGAPSQDSALAFGRRWVEVLNEAYRKVDPSEIARISEPSCTACSNYITSLTNAGQAGERYRGGEITVAEAVAAPPENAMTVVSIAVGASELTELDRLGRVVRTFPAVPRSTLQVEVRAVAGSWKIVEVTRS